MKKLNILAGLLMGVFALFATSCDQDLDNNPVLQNPTTFVLNTPAYSSNVDLATSDSLSFTWSQPDYGFPVAAKYQLQFSPDDNWTTSTEEAAADESGALVPTYASLGDETGVVRQSVGAADLAKALEQIKNYPEGQVPANQEVYVRATSTLNGKTIASNTVKINVNPYYVELKDAAPELWYLTGSCIGDGSWSSTIGAGVLPMYTMPGETYDKKTGQGKISWTGYLTPDGFKIKKLADNWDVQIGQGAAFGEYDVDNGGSGNITVPEAGIYTITLDTKQYAADQAAKKEKTTALTIEKYAGTVNVRDGFSLAGDFNGWDTAANAMNPVHTAVENHDWFATVTISADGGIKFTNADWSVNFGALEFPYGVGVQNGDNIPAKAGTYQVFLNDITGQYTFIAQ